MATDVLRGALNTDAKSPVERFGGVLTGGSIQKRGQAAREAMPTIMQESAQAAGQAKRTELEATNQQIGREAAAEEEAATKLRTETERIRGLEQPYQEFKAPEYTAADYAKGAAKRALVGVLLGGIAKTSAMTQLKAIKAMQDAERDGRTQDFEAARLNFDEAEKKRADFNKRLQTELSDFQQLLVKDTAAARLKAKMMTTQMIDGLASAAERNQNYRQFMEILTNATNQSNELEMEAFKQQGQQKVEEIRAEGRANEDDKPSKAERDQIVARASLQERIPQLIEIVKKGKDQLGVQTLLPELLISRLGQDGIELRSGLAQINADYRFSKGGKALTKNENEILQGVTDWKGKTADSIISQLKALENYVETDQDIYRRLYPNYMSRLSGRKSFASEEEADAAFAAKKIQDGERILINGRRATYRADKPKEDAK